MKIKKNEWLILLGLGAVAVWYITSQRTRKSYYDVTDQASQVECVIKSIADLCPICQNGDTEVCHSCILASGIDPNGLFQTEATKLGCGL